MTSIDALRHNPLTDRNRHGRHSLVPFVVTGLGAGAITLVIALGLGRSEGVVQPPVAVAGSIDPGGNSGNGLDAKPIPQRTPESTAVPPLPRFTPDRPAKLPTKVVTVEPTKVKVEPTATAAPAEVVTATTDLDKVIGWGGLSAEQKEDVAGAIFARGQDFVQNRFCTSDTINQTGFSNLGGGRLGVLAAGELGNTKSATAQFCLLSLVEGVDGDGNRVLDHVVGWTDRSGKRAFGVLEQATGMFDTVKGGTPTDKLNGGDYSNAYTMDGSGRMTHDQTVGLLGGHIGGVVVYQFTVAGDLKGVTLDPKVAPLVTSNFDRVGVNARLIGGVYCPRGTGDVLRDQLCSTGGTGGAGLKSVGDVEKALSGDGMLPRPLQIGVRTK